MPARWASSEGPLFVRTVLVNGVRHAILNQDDPILQILTPSQPPPSANFRGSRRPSSRSSISTYDSSCSRNGASRRAYRGKKTERLEHCLINLQLVLSTNPPTNQNKNRQPTVKRNCDEPTPPSSILDPSVSPCVIRCCELHHRSDTDTSCSVEGQVPSRADALLRQNDIPYVSRHLFNSFEDDESYLLRDVESYLPDFQLNPLSERVLQWLDLAGKGNDTPSVSDAMMDWENRPQLRGKRRGGGGIIASAPTQRVSRREVLRTSPPVTAKVEQKNNNIAEHLRVNARGLKTRRKRYQAFTDINISEQGQLPTSQPKSASPPSSKSSGHVKNSERSHKDEQDCPSFKVKTSRDRKSKRQLHIFMPVLVKDDSSECSSFWNER